MRYCCMARLAGLRDTLSIARLLQIGEVWAAVNLSIIVGRRVVMCRHIILGRIIVLGLHLRVCFRVPVDFRIPDMQRQSGAALCRRIGRKHYQRCRVFFYDAGKSKPGGKRYLSHQLLLDFAQIDDDKP